MVRILQRRNTRIQPGPSGLDISLTYWVGWFPFVFVVLWTLFWVSISTNPTSPAKYLERAVSIPGFVTLIWWIFGRETITFDAQSITIFRGIFGVGRSRSFSLSDVRDMRVGTWLDPRAGGRWEPSLVHAIICFEVRGKTQRFVNGLAQVEASRVLEAIRKHYPLLVFTNAGVPASNN